MLSLQQDMIQGEARPKWKYRSEGGSGKDITLTDEGVIHLKSDEDIERLKAVLDTFPTQVHGNQLMELPRPGDRPQRLGVRSDRASANSGRALATAWRSVAARLVPRLRQTPARSTCSPTSSSTRWSSTTGTPRAISTTATATSRRFPNQEPRDFMEVTSVAINKKNAGGIDAVAMMEEWGEKSPDEMLERVRADYTDVVLHPRKLRFSVVAVPRAADAVAGATAGHGGGPPRGRARGCPQHAPGGAPGPNPGAANAAATQAQTQAAQQAAPGAPRHAAAHNSGRASF